MSITEPITRHKDFSIIPKGGDIYVLRFHQHDIVDDGRMALIGHELAEFVDSKQPGQGERTVIVDLEGVEHMNSGITGTMVGLHSKLRRHGDKPLVIADAGENVGEIFKITKLDKLFTIAPSVDAALALAQGVGTQQDRRESATPAGEKKDNGSATTLTEQDGVAVLKINLPKVIEPQQSAAIFRAIDGFAADPAHAEASLVVDFSAVKHMASDFANDLARKHQDPASPAHNRLLIAGLQKQPTEILRLTHIGRQLDIYDDVNSAIAAVKGERRR